MKNKLCIALGLSIFSLVFSSEKPEFVKCDRSSDKSCFEQLLDAAQKDKRNFCNPKVQTSYGVVRIWIKTNGPRAYIRFDGPDDSCVDDFIEGKLVTLVSENLLSSDSLVAAAYAEMYLAGLAGKESECPGIVQDSKYACLKSQIDKAHYRLDCLKQSIMRTYNHGVWHCELSCCYQISEEEANQMISEQTAYFLYHAKQYDAEMVKQK